MICGIHSFHNNNNMQVLPRGGGGGLVLGGRKAVPYFLFQRFNVLMCLGSGNLGCVQLS